MFQQAIPTEMKNKVKKLDENQNFLNEIIQSLSGTYEGHVKWERKSNLGTTVLFSKDTRDLEDTLTFKITEKGVEFSAELYYGALGCFDLKEVYANEKRKKIAYEFKSRPKNLVGKKLPKWVTVKQRNTYYGNSYSFNFNLKKSDKNLKQKIEIITKILMRQGFKIRFDAVA